MATDTGLGEVRLFEDFLDDTINAWMWTVNTDGGGTAAITTETENGVFQLYNAGNDGQIESIFGAEIWQPSVQGTIVFEARVQMQTSILTGCYIGLSGDNDTDQMPADIDGGTTLATDADDVCGFVYDSDKGSNWYIITSKATANGALTSCAVGPTLNTYQTFRIVVETTGDCRFFIDGDEITTSGAARKAAITTTVQFCPCVGRLCLGTAGIVAVDYIYLSAGRA